MNYCVYVLMLLALPEIAFTQNTTPTLTAGPFAGSVTTTSAKVWIAYRGSGAFTVTLSDTNDNTIANPIATSKIGDRDGDTSMILDFTGLKAGHSFIVTYTLTAKNAPDCRFTAQTDVAVKDMDFLFGSCAYMTTGCLKMFFPGTNVRIFRHMTKAKSDFMVWLGDNIYYIVKDYKSYDNMFRRQLNIRESFKSLQTFLATQPNYAIWDDHDYGWNDADKTFPLKDTALKVFRGFWPNTYESTVKETYFTFRYADAEFFMTDGRWFRNPPGDTAGDFLGAEQLRWLKNKLLNSDATFKFICMGSQVLNDNEHGESYAHYPKERNDLLNYIVDNNIKGVIFLTGDKHYAELSKRDWRGYTFYDFTSSPLTSVVLPHKWVKSFHNPLSVKGTVIYSKNYGRIKITGTQGNRSLRLELYGKGGNLRWERVIKSEELGRK